MGNFLFPETCGYDSANALIRAPWHLSDKLLCVFAKGFIMETFAARFGFRSQRIALAAVSWHNHCDYQ